MRSREFGQKLPPDEKFIGRVQVSVLDVVELCGHIDDEDENVQLLCVVLLVERLM